MLYEQPSWSQVSHGPVVRWTFDATEHFKVSVHTGEAGYGIGCWYAEFPEKTHRLIGLTSNMSAEEAKREALAIAANHLRELLQCIEQEMA